DRGWNILCEPYIVQKDDWVFKLFREKGEISHIDFPKFLRIFERLNPHIHDLDHIRPGQRILIPLKKVDADIASEQSSGVVTIPYFSAKDLPGTKTKPATDYRVKNGDCVSILIAERYGKYGTESYHAGENLFRKLNPKIENLNLIYAGQVIRLPNPQIKTPALPLPLNNVAVPAEIPVSSGSIAASDEKALPTSVVKVDEKSSDSTLSNVASILDARLYNKGSYYLPRHGQEDYQLDLSRTPFIKLENGTRIFFFTGNDPSQPDTATLESFWKDVRIVTIEPGDSTEKILETVFGKLEAGGLKRILKFSDHGVRVEVQGKWIIEESRKMGEPARSLCITLIHNPKEQTPAPIVRYLDQNNIIIKDIIMGKSAEPSKTKVFPLINVGGPVDITVNGDRKVFVKDFLNAVGYQYILDQPVSFQYAGVQIHAAADLAADNNGNSFLIDFGNFYGDALQAIEESGTAILQIRNNDTLDDIIQKLLGAMAVTFSRNPSFLAAKRPAVDNTKLTIPGFLMDHQDTGETLITLAPLNHEVIQYLTDDNIKIVRIDFQGKKNE
ncbi:MAG: LysM peptidoglycan-binding domain-containing protein, partial [Desulfobacterales bacterium]